ncbi:hypothetical protein P12x_003505 [Tundrisphaera lichenicola]|uniref:hypothetical protein n=1 Tax=Tundrisphaera lichenicola TaxID=2029860 RepID=UPI003EB78710
MTNPTPAHHPRRWWKALGLVLVLIVGIVAVLPWLVGSRVGRSRLAERLNRALAPGHLEFQSLSVSWFGPTRLGEVVLKDPKGATVVSTPSAQLDRTLGRWILGSTRTLTLDLGAASLDVQRSEDGIIDLAQALQTILASPDPTRDLAIKIDGGTLQYRDPFLAEPSEADSVDLMLRIRPSPDPVTWRLRLARGESSTLEVQGDFDRWLSRGGSPRTPDLQFTASGQRWPFVVQASEINASGQLDGTLDFLRRHGHWRISGDSKLLGIRAGGSPLNGDILALEQIDAGWDLSEGEDGWAIRRLSIQSPIGDLKAEGQLNGPSGIGHQKVEGEVNLAAIARQIPHALHLRDSLRLDRGSARLAVDMNGEPGRTSFDVVAQVSDLAASDGDRTLSLNDPATLTARLIRRGQDSTLERLAIKTAYLDASAEGELERGVDLVGSLDLGGFRKQLDEWVDLGQLQLSGRADLAGNYRLLEPDGPAARFENRLKATFHDLRIEGLGGQSIRRDEATLDASSEGPADPSGIPKGWETISISAQSNGSSARLRLEQKKGPIEVGGSAQIGIDLGERKSNVLATLGGKFSSDGQTLRIETLDLLRTRDGQKAEGPEIVVSTRGNLDFSRGEMVLEASPNSSSGIVMLDSDGLRISGIGEELARLRIDGSFLGDSSLLDRTIADLTGGTLLGLSGGWSAQVSALGDADGLQLGGKIGLDEGPAFEGQQARPTSVAAIGHYSTGADRLDLSEFTIITGYGTLDASGRIENPGGIRRVDLKGRLSPDFGAINSWLSSRVEKGAKVEGHPRSFVVSGNWVEDPSGRLSSLVAELGFDLDGADIYGMQFGPAPVVLRAKNGKLSFDPIGTTINEGHIRLEPEIDLDAPGGPILRLAKNSAIREARINDEVSRRVLAFVAPILDQATRARGLVSVDLDHAEFPIGPGRGQEVKVEGAVVFEDVEFAPGPLANDLLSAIGRRDAGLKLDRPVTLTIADGRVNQRGMSIPIGELTRIEMAGWVDFDRNLAITATVPVTSAMLGNNALLSDIAAGTMVKLPIRGTLDRPMIDREAMTSNLQEMGKSLLTRGATLGALELMKRLARPRDPDAPPPAPRMTPQERKALRQEKKAIRRGEIPIPPSDPGQ